MAVVDITIKERIASAPAGVELVCNNPTDTIHFNFDEEWNGLNEKTARFSWEGKYVEVSFIGDSVKVPEIYKTDYVFVGVYGVQIASTPVKVQCKRSILCYGDTVRAPLTDPFYEEFCDRINAAEEKVSEMQEVIDSTYTYLEDGGSPLNIPGNAGTATKLHTPVNIGEASFDGSDDVTLTDMGAVSYSEQTFSDEQKAQARENIDAAKTSHAHGSITNDGKLGSTSGRIITTGTSGKMQASTPATVLDLLGLSDATHDIEDNSDRIEALETYKQRPYEYVGNLVALENYEGMPMNCTIHMEPIQSGSGDPTPDNVRPIAGRTSVKLVRCSKNLLGVDFSALPDKSWKTSAEKIDGGVRIIANGTDNYVYSRWLTGIPVENPDMIGKEFTLTADSMPSGDNIPAMFLGVYKPDGILTLEKASPQNGSGRFSVSCTITEEMVGIGNCIGVTLYATGDNKIGNTVGAYTDYTNIQLELGAATEYEANQGDSYTLNLGCTVYGGTLDVRSGLLTVDRKYVKITHNDVIGYAGEGAAPNVFRMDVSRTVIGSKSNYAIGSVCDRYRAAMNWNELVNSDLTFAVAENDRLRVHDNRANTEDDFIALFEAMGGVEICYVLAEPEVIQLTPTEVAALQGSNVLYTNGDSMTVSGRTDILWLTSHLNEQSTPDEEVTETGTKAVSGAAVAAYVAEQLAAITDYEEVEF